MANTNAPSGFVPTEHLTGGEIRLKKYSIANAYNTAIYYGQNVKQSGTGRNVEAAATTLVTSVGIFQGCEYPDSTGTYVFSKYWPASTATYGSVGATAYVIDDPRVIYTVQMSAGCVEADIGQLVDSVGTSGSTVTGISSQQLDSSLITTSGQFRLYGLAPIEGNAYGTNAKVLAMYNEHVFLTTTAV